MIPTGVNLQVFQTPDSKEEISALRQKLGYTDQTPVLLSLSRVAFEKNIHALVEAMPDILEKEPAAQLLIVGGGAGAANPGAPGARNGVARPRILYRPSG